MYLDGYVHISSPIPPFRSLHPPQRITPTTTTTTTSAIHTSLVKHQTPHLNALPGQRIRRRQRIHKRRMRRAHRDAVPPPGPLALPKRIKALEQQDLVGLHILGVVEAVVLAGPDPERLAPDLVPLRRPQRLLVGDALLPTIIVILYAPALRVEQIHRHEVVRRRAPPVDHAQRELRRRAPDRPPHVDDLVPALQQALRLGGVLHVPSDPRRCRPRRLVYVHELDGAARRVRRAPSDRVVEDDDLADFLAGLGAVGAVVVTMDAVRRAVGSRAVVAAVREVLPEQRLHLGVVRAAHRRVVQERGFRRGRRLPEQREARAVRGEPRCGGGRRGRGGCAGGKEAP